MDSNLIKIELTKEACEYSHTLENNDLGEIVDSFVAGLRVMKYTQEEIKQAFTDKFLHVLLNKN